MDSNLAAVTIAVKPLNDAALIGGVATGRVTEDHDAQDYASGLLTISDVDGAPEEAFQAGIYLGSHGRLDLKSSGLWFYNVDPTDGEVQALNAGSCERQAGWK